MDNKSSSRDSIRELLAEHSRKYPVIKAEDFFKLLYHGAFGCEHLVSSPRSALEGILREYERHEVVEYTAPEAINEKYCRVSLSVIGAGLSPKTLARLFYLSAREESDGVEALSEGLSVLRELAERGDVPISPGELDEKIYKWQELGYPALHHSDAFRNEYAPSYRVISRRFAEFIPLFIKIDSLLDEKGRAAIAIDGGSASGKTTLSRILEEVYGCAVYHIDDFFLQPKQRTRERYSELGGNFDRERFLDEVLLPLSRGEAVCYRPFDCSKMELGDIKTVEPNEISVVEGAYSMHPELMKYYGISVFLDIDENLQRKRILTRNPTMAQQFFEKWIPLENRYFEGFKIPEKCSLIFKISEK